jgi:putative phage-type endonuclease
VTAYDIVCSAEDREPWLASRMTGIGASEIAGACGESKWDSPYSIWAMKTCRLPGKDETEAMVWGKLLEPVVLSEYARRTGRGSRRHGTLLRSKDHPWALASLDGETWLAGAQDDVWPLEIKTASAYAADEWQEGPPRGYYLQVQQQILVTGARRATSVCLIGGQQMVWCDIERDDIAINRIIAKGEELWRRILRDEPPPVDGSEATLSALAYAFPRDDGKTVLLSFDAMDLADRFDAAKDARKTANAKIDALEAQIKSLIGANTRAILPDGRGWSWTCQKRESYVVPAGESRVLRRVNPKKQRKVA